MQAAHRLEVLQRHLVPADASGAVFDREPLLRTRADYERLYEWSIKDPASFWANEAAQFYWEKMWDMPGPHMSCNLDVRNGPIRSEWFKGGRTNLSYNCLDVWVARSQGGRRAFIWEGNDPGQQRTMTYSQVLAEVCKLSNWMLANGVKKGDCVTIYLPMMCELPIAMLACARIGAVHSVVFAGFSAESLSQRIMDCNGKVVLTALGMARGPKRINLKKIVDEALRQCEAQGHKVARLLVAPDPSDWPRDPSAACAAPPSPKPQGLVAGRDCWWPEAVGAMLDTCPPAWLDAEDRLFLLYTSGSTGKPKGVVHSQGGFMVGAAAHLKYPFDLREGDVFMSTSDCGWVTGHVAVTYGPLLLGATSVVFGAVPTHPTPARTWQVVEEHKVRQLYTAPTLIRSLLQLGDRWVLQHNLSSLRVLGSVGEPIGEHAWRWLHDVVGGGRAFVSDTWWQTETGSVMITTLPAPWCPQKPGAAGLPFFSVQPMLVDQEGREQRGNSVAGKLCLLGPMPSFARTLHGDHARFETEYYKPYPGLYFTGDGARRDEDGLYWITGRVDDVINVSGHRIGTAEVEGVLTEHDEVAEAAVVGVEHPVKGQALYAYVTLRDAGRQGTSMRAELEAHVRAKIGAFAVPDTVHWAPALPKTRSGKIMRRVLRKIATGQEGELGDTSTMAEPGVVEVLVKLRPGVGAPGK